MLTEVEESLGDDNYSRRGSGDTSLLQLRVWFMVLACIVSVLERGSM